jgi:hypothetical protein
MLDVILQPADVLVALNALTAQEIGMETDGRRVRLFDKTCEVILSRMHGEFPDLGKLPRTQPHKVTVPRNAITTIQRAANAFDNARLATLEATDGRLRMYTRGQERGAFELGLGRHVADFSLTFDATLLGAAASLGRKVNFAYEDGVTIVLMTGDTGKYFWLSPIRVS